MAYLEHDLDADALVWMEQHRAHCSACAVMAQELDEIVADARTLAPLTPDRDLWPDIVTRLETPVVPLDRDFRSASSAVAIAQGFPSSLTRSTGQGMGRSVSLRRFAVAATMLVALSSAVTWQIMRQPALPVVAANPFDSVADAGTIRPVANVNAVYQTEIDGLRAVVTERYAELDSNTVAVLQRNLAIIDRAIADCREALAKDPNNRVLTTTLDRALASKLALMRQVALL